MHAVLNPNNYLWLTQFSKVKRDKKFRNYLITYVFWLKILVIYVI